MNHEKFVEEAKVGVRNIKKYNKKIYKQEINMYNK